MNSSSSTPEILARTRQWLVLLKPAGWLTIPGRPGAEGTSTPPVLSQWAQSQAPEALVVHRLDRETSGVVLFALSPEAHRQANQWFQEHQVKKAYDCLAVGDPKTPMMRIKKPVNGQASLTQIEVKERYPAGFLARAVPLTGRRHQIRIHLASEGYPLFGDVEYRGPRTVEIAGESVTISRVALHSVRLELPSKEVFEAPWPADFREWVEKLRKGEGRV